MLRHLIALGSSIALFCDVAVAEPPFEVAPTRCPFLPSLIEINEPQLCAPFLATAIAAYKGPDFDIRTVGQDLSSLSARWILSAEDIAAQFEGPDGRLPLSEVRELTQIRWSWDLVTSTVVDFNGNGDKNILAIIGTEDNALRHSYVTALFHNEADFEGALAKAGSVEQILESATIVWDLDRPSILQIDNAFYAIPNPQSFHLKDFREELWRLAPDSARIACVVQLEPGAAERTIAPQLIQTPIGSMSRVLDAIAGHEPRCTGTLHFMSMAVTDAAQVYARTASRPWALSGIEPYNDEAEIDAALDRWSQRGLWNHRMLRQLRHSVPAAHDFLRDYYQHAFGLSETDAGALADHNFDLLIRTRFKFPRNPWPEDTNDPSFRLRRALLAQYTAEQVEELLDAAGISNAHVESRWGTSTEPTLFYALENPILVDLLLDRGADINARGNFNKTALMYAAQFNLPETAKRLLERGADINAATSGEGDCWTNVNVSERTALMYAAENADLEMVDLLLEHGANPLARDSAKCSADMYVDGNGGLTESAKLELYQRLRTAKGTP
jgi:hypothetical protein